MTLDHVGIAVESIEGALPFYRDALGLVVECREEVRSQNVRVAFLKDPSEDRARIELLEAAGEEGAVARFLRSRGPGMHHAAFRALDIAETMKQLKDSGRPALEDAPLQGARGHRVCFLHPRRAHGVLIELVG